MWRLWPHLRRLWAVTGAVILGLTVTYIYSAVSEQALPHFRIVTQLLHDYWLWFGGAAVTLAMMSIVAERAHRHREVRAPRPLKVRQSLLEKLGLQFGSSRPPLRPRSSLTGLAGRDAELTRLDEWFAQVRTGKRRLVFVSGGQGIGKTALVRTFLDSISGDRAVRVGRGNCVEQHGTTEPYMAVLEALTRLCRGPDGERIVAIMHRLAPAALAQLPSVVTVEDRARLHGQAQGVTPNRMLREIVEALEAMAARAPIVLIIEDLHWGDPSTIDLLRALARRTEPAQLLIVATHREIESLPDDHPLRALRDELGSHHQCAELALRQLSEEELAKSPDGPGISEEARSLAQSHATVWPTALLAGIGLLIVGALVYGVVRWRSWPANFTGQPTELLSIKSIAVLPLDNYSGDPKQECFADGMTDELTTDLATISALRVISRGSVMQFKGANRPPTPQIGKMLNVDAVVEGSVVRVGDRVRITAQLIDASTDRHLWAESFERDSRDVLALQDDLASAIAQKINVQLTPSEQARLSSAPTVIPEAYDAYLKGRYFFSRPSDENLVKAITHFKEAVQLDPNFAPAYSGLSDAYLWAGFNEGVLTSAEAMPLVKATAEKALQLDDDSAEAHTSLAVLKTSYEFDWDGAEHEFQKAIELNPSYPFAHDQFGVALAWHGRLDEARGENQHAMEIDPLSPEILFDAAGTLIWQRKYDAAKDLSRKLREIDATLFLSPFVDGMDRYRPRASRRRDPGIRTRPCDGIASLRCGLPRLRLWRSRGER
jgi:TolB-like protein